MIKSLTGDEVRIGEIASLKKSIEVSSKARIEQQSDKPRKALDPAIVRKKSLGIDEAVVKETSELEEAPTRDMERPFEFVQSNIGGTITEGISPYPDADTGFGEERLQALFGPGVLGVNPLFAAVGIAAVSVTDNSSATTTATTTEETQPGVSNVSGVVIDGYIRGAKVFFDTDGDGQHDEGEAFTITDDEGKYVLEVSQGVEGVIRAVGGININSDGSDGAPNTATLSAPLVRTDGKSIALNITPVTSLIEALVQSEDGLTVDEASSRLATALGFPAVDLLTFDSILAETQGEDSAQQAQALLLNKIAAQVVSLINSVSAALQPDAASRAAVDSVVAQSVAQQVVTKIINSESSNFESLSSFLDSNALNLVVKTAVSAVMDIEAANGESPVRDIASVVAVAQGSATAQFAAIDRASSAISIAAEQVAIFNNKAPTAGASQTISVVENSKDVGVFEATDPDEGDVIAYSLAGNDAVFFDIDSMTGSVRFKIAPDFEQLEGRPFQFTVLATDKFGASSTRQVTVNVTDVDEVEAIKALMVQIAQLKKDLADSKTKQEAIQKASEEEITKLKAEVDALTKSGLAKDGDLDAVKKQIAELEAKSAQAAKDAAVKELDLGKQIEALQTSGKAKDADIAALKDDLAKAKASAEVAQKALAAEVTTLKDDVSTLKVTLAAREADIAQLKKDLADSKTKQEAIQKASEEEITKLKAEVDALTKSGLAKDGDLDAVKKQIAELEAKSALAAKDAAVKEQELGKKIAELEVSGKAKDADIAALKDDLAKAKASAEVAQKALAAEVTTLKDDVSTLKVTLAAREADIAQLKKDLADSKTKQEAIQKASEEEITKLKAEVDALTKSGLAKDGDLDAVKKQIAELEAKSALAAKDAAVKEQELGKKIAELEVSGKAKDADIAALKDELTKAKASAEVAQKALAAEVTTLKDDVSTLKVTLAAREEDVAVLKKIIEELGPQIDKVILGSTGNDTITNKTGENFIYGLSGNDTIVFNGFGELFDGGMVDLINGGPGVDTLRLVEANRTIEFTESWAKASGIEVLQVAGTQDNVNGFQAHLNKSAFTAGIRTIDLREIVAMPDAALSSVVDGSNAASDQGLSILGTSGNDLFTGGAGQDTLVAFNGADVYRGAAGSDSIDLSEISPSRDRVVFEATGEFNGVDYIKGFATGLASSQADVLDLSAFMGGPAGPSVTLSDGTSGDIIRLLDLEGGQDITTEKGLQDALRSGDEYSNINIAANAKSIVVTSGSLESGDSFVFMLTGDESGMASAQLVAVVENVSLNAFTADNFAV